MLRLSLLLACCSVAATDEYGTAPADKGAVEQALYIRGLSCDGCSLAEQQLMLKQKAATRIDAELQAMLGEEVTYRRHVRELKLDKETFLRQLNTTEDHPLDEAHAQRVWTAFESQLHSGGLRFKENGSVVFAMPVTHRMAHWLPAAACDVIEDAFMLVRGQYIRRVPRKVRRRLERRLDYAAESGILYNVLTALIVLLLVDLAHTTFSSWRREEAADVPVDRRSKRE